MPPSPLAAKLAVSTLTAVFAPDETRPAAVAARFLDWACAEALRPYLGAREDSAGLRLAMRLHRRNRLGEFITAFVEIVGLEHERVEFHVVCRDEHGLLCEAAHERIVYTPAATEIDALAA